MGVSKRKDLRAKAIKELLVMAGGLPDKTAEPTPKQVAVFEGIDYKLIIRPLVHKEKQECPELTYAYFSVKWDVTERTIRWILNRS